MSTSRGSHHQSSADTHPQEQQLVPQQQPQQQETNERLSTERQTQSTQHFQHQNKQRQQEHVIPNASSIDSQTVPSVAQTAQRPSANASVPSHYRRIPTQFQGKIMKRPKAYYGFCRLDRYQIIKQLGKGTFGVVYKGIHKPTDNYVAIKKILIHKGSDCFPVTAFREIDILKDLHKEPCENIIELIEMIRDRPPPNDDYTNYDSSKAPKKIKKSFYMVFPYMSYDLSGILGNPSVNLTEPDIKSIIVQLLKGINFIHDHNYLHRDIKAANILVNWDGVLKIGDFGLARSYNGPTPTLESPGGGQYPLTEVVMTRWYRAPEVLFGDKLYTTAVDIWGIGCVFGELYERKPILPGKSDLDQAYDIFKLVGEANEKTVTHMDRYKFQEKNIQLKPTRRTLEERFGKLISPEGVDLLGKMLLLDPQRRITGLKALDHPFFKVQPLPTEKVDVCFSECHEADIARFKEENKKKANGGYDNNNKNTNTNNDNYSKRPYPNGLPPNGPNSIPVAGFSNGVTKPRTAFIKQQSDRLPHNDNRLVQRPAHPQDLNTPPPAPTHPAHYQSNTMDYQRGNSNNTNNGRYGGGNNNGSYARRGYDNSPALMRRPPTQQSQTYHKYGHGQDGERYKKGHDSDGFQGHNSHNNSMQKPYYPRGGHQWNSDRPHLNQQEQPPFSQQQGAQPQYVDRGKPYHHSTLDESRNREAAKRRKLPQDGGMDY